MTSTGTKATQTMPNLLDFQDLPDLLDSPNLLDSRNQSSSTNLATWTNKSTQNTGPHGHATQTRPPRNRTIPTKDSKDKPQNQDR